MNRQTNNLVNQEINKTINEKMTPSCGTRQRHHRFKRFFLLFGIPVALFIPLAIVMKQLPFLLNLTPSMPIGIYHIHPINQRINHIKRGDEVVVCLPNTIAQVGLLHHYLQASDECQSGVEPVLKKIIALPGDHIVLTNTHIRVNGRDYLARRFRISPAGHQIHAWIHPGHYQAVGYWLYGQAQPNLSWDSRYYGGVPKTAIIHRVKPVWVYTPAATPIQFLLKGGAHVQTS